MIINIGKRLHQKAKLANLVTDQTAICYRPI